MCLNRILFSCLFNWFTSCIFLLNLWNFWLIFLIYFNIFIRFSTSFFRNQLILFRLLLILCDFIKILLSYLIIGVKFGQTEEMLVRQLIINIHFFNLARLIRLIIVNALTDSPNSSCFQCASFEPFWLPPEKPRILISFYDSMLQFLVSFPLMIFIFFCIQKCPTV